MTTNLPSFSLPGQANATKTILWSALVAGTLDALAGVVVYFLFFGYNPLQVLQWIASGIFGPSAITGGLLTVVVGLVLHYFIAFVAAGIYFFSFPKIKSLVNNPVVPGLLFGAAIWAVMNLIVIPLSNIPPAPFNVPLAIIAITWHIVLVGLPISLITNSYYKSTQA
jgi:hypothetical protein